MSFRIEEDGQFRGQVTFLSLVAPANSVGNTQLKSSDPAEPEKLRHQHRANYAQESNTTAAAEDRVVHAVKGTAGKVKTFKTGCVVACIGDSTVTVDLHKNGASILTAAIVIDSGDAAYALVAGTIGAVDTVVAGDVLEVVVTVSAGTGTLGKGVFAYADVFEDVS